MASRIILNNKFSIDYQPLFLFKLLSRFYCLYCNVGNLKSEKISLVLALYFNQVDAFSIMQGD